MPQPIDWQSYHSAAGNATKAIDQLPFVFGARDTQNFHAGTTPEQAFHYMYGPQNKAAWPGGGATSSLQSLLGLLQSGGSALLGDDLDDDRDDGGTNVPGGGRFNLNTGQDLTKYIGPGGQPWTGWDGIPIG